MLKLDKTLEGVGLALNCIPDTRGMGFADIVKMAQEKGSVSFPTGVDGCKLVVTAKK